MSDHRRFQLDPQLAPVGLPCLQPLPLVARELAAVGSEAPFGKLDWLHRHLAYAQVYVYAVSTKQKYTYTQ